MQIFYIVLKDLRHNLYFDAIQISINPFVNEMRAVCKLAIVWEEPVQYQSY